jgi:hypothetical protein
MLQEIGEIVVIGLKAREDRWLRCKKIFEDNGVTQVTRVVTEKDENNPHRNYMNDFTRVLRLKRWNNENIVFFEDDFEFVDGWEEVLRKAWEDVPKDFDILYLGCNPTRALLKVTDNVVRVKGAWLMHATILSRKFIDDILKNYDFNQVYIIDEWYRRIACDKKFYCTWPMISYQRVDYSDFLKKKIDYNIFENKFVKSYEDTHFSKKIRTNV